MNHSRTQLATDVSSSRRPPARYRWFVISKTLAVPLIFFGSFAAISRAQNSCQKTCTSEDGVCSGLTGTQLATCRKECQGRCPQTGPGGPLLDPGCNDRTMKGTIHCTIEQPVVTQHETTYANIQFAPGDTVFVEAAGCVQTGGSGSTWKRYVNPSGDNSEKWYHGLIRIPTGTKDSALVRIQSVIGKPIVVSGNGVPLSQLVLHLGYEDNYYSDNGYYAHNDGTDDQCKLSFDNDGGPAHITVTIYRGTLPSGPQGGLLDFDVVSSALDPNGLPFNPMWSWQARPENRGNKPPTSLCNNFSTRHSNAGVPDFYMSPSFPANCTDQADMSTVDLPTDPNATLCKVGWPPRPPYTDDTFAGHVNWFPITVEGNAGRVTNSDVFPFGDDDYTFSFTSEVPGDPLSINTRPGLHVEYDSDETIDNFTIEEWKQLRDAEDNGNEADKEALSSGHTILTGMFGLDGEHDLKAELHPLYAMATRIPRDNLDTEPDNEAWLMFVRNQGDEGYCSSKVWDAGFEDYTVRLPWRKCADSVSVDWDRTDFEGTDGTSGPTVAAIPDPSPNAGVYVSFHLGPPVHTSYIFDPGASRPFIDGVLHLKWNQPAPGTLASHGLSSCLTLHSPAGTATSAAPEKDTDEVEQGLATAINKLSPAQRQTMAKARRLPGAATAVTHRLPPGGPVHMMTATPPVVRVAHPHAISGGDATQKLARDAAQMKALCAATNNAPPGLPATVCTGNTPHR